MATLSVETIVRTGLGAAYSAAASGGDGFANNGATFVHIVNAHASAARAVTFTAQTSAAAGLAVADRVVSVPGPSERFIGPFPKSAFNDENGLCQMTYDSEADLTIAVLKLA